MGGSRLAKMADEEEELGTTSGHEVEHKYTYIYKVFRKGATRKDL